MTFQVKLLFFSVEEGPPLSTKEVRLATVLREMPYAIAFSQRVHLFHNLVARDKEDHQGDRVNFLQGKAIHVHIRRNFIYEDAFEKLSSDNGKTNSMHQSTIFLMRNFNFWSKLFILTFWSRQFCREPREQFKKDARSFHQYSCNSEVETTWTRTSPWLG